MQGTKDGAVLADDDETRVFLLVVIVHSADLYNAFKPFASSQRWTQRLYREFNLQVGVDVGVDVGVGVMMELGMWFGSADIYTLLLTIRCCSVSLSGRWG
jgi:hypothetical protein